MANTFKTPGIIVLAAGHGTRMRSPLPKVLTPLAGRPFIHHILEKVCEAAPESPVAVVVGYEREKVKDALNSSRHPFLPRKIEFVVQEEQKGTGHAVQCVMDSAWGKKCVDEGRALIVLPGDLPLIPSTLVSALAAPLKKGSVVRLLTTLLPDPSGYGRVIRKGKAVQRIVEQKDASVRERQIKEVAASIYSFDAGFLARSLPKLRTGNAQGEYYLTDLIGMSVKAKKAIDVLCWDECEDLRGINNPWEWTVAARLLNRRYIRDWAERLGVRFHDSENTWLEAGVKLSEGVEIHPGAILRGTTTVGEGAVIGPSVVLENVEVGARANLKTGTVASDSKIAAGAQLGPYAHLRPGSVVGEESKIGNFVELKATTIGRKTSVAHLSYLGDAVVGSNVNIGCGFVTCNFDGRVIDGKRKHATVIEDGVFMGSDCQTIAPVRIGKGAYVASGSTITESVEPEALAIARSRQVNKPGYAAKLKKEG